MLVSILSRISFSWLDHVANSGSIHLKISCCIFIPFCCCVQLPPAALAGGVHAGAGHYCCPGNYLLFFARRLLILQGDMTNRFIMISILFQKNASLSTLQTLQKKNKRLKDASNYVIISVQCWILMNNTIIQIDRSR